MYTNIQIKFDIPYGLIWNKEKVQVRIGNISCFVEFEKELKNGHGGMSFQNIEMFRDRTGKTSITHIICEISPENNTFDNEKELIAHYQNLALSAVNRVLEVYKIVTGEFHLQNLRFEDLDNIQSQLYSDDQPTKNFFLQHFPGGMGVARFENMPMVAKKLLAEGEPFAVWEIALLNAKNYLDLEDYPQAIVQANIALENFLYTHIYDRLNGIMEVSEIDEFMKGHSVCKTCSLQVDPDNPVLVLNPSPPSMYQVAKLMYSSEAGVPLPGISNAKRKEIIENINRNRNDIVHGRNQNHIEEKDAKTAVESLETLIGLSLIGTIA